MANPSPKIRSLFHTIMPHPAGRHSLLSLDLPSLRPSEKRELFRKLFLNNFCKHVLESYSSSLPDPPKPVIGPVPLEGVSPSVIDQSNRSSVASFLHRQKPLSKEHFPEIYKSKNGHIYIKSSGALGSTRSLFNLCLIVLQSVVDPEPEVVLPIASSHKVAVVMGCSRNMERTEFVCSVQVGLLKYFVLNESLLEYSHN